MWWLVADLVRSLTDLVGDDPSHGLPQDDFPESPIDLQMVRKREDELDERVVEEREAHLPRVSHAVQVRVVQQTLKPVPAIQRGVKARRKPADPSLPARAPPGSEPTPDGERLEAPMRCASQPRAR